MLVLVFTGLAAICIAVFARIMFRRYPLLDPLHGEHSNFSMSRCVNDGAALNIENDTDLDSENRNFVEHQDAQSGLRIIFTDFDSLLMLLIAFSMSFRSRTFYIMTGSLWMYDTFHLIAAHLGLITIAVVFGVICGLSSIGYISQKIDLWITAVGTLSYQLLIGTLLFVLSAIYGNNISLFAAVFFIFAITSGDETAYVVAQTNAVRYAPLSRLKYTLLLGQLMTQEIAAILALLITVPVWRQFGDDSLLAFATIWIGCTFINSLMLLLYRREPNDKLMP